MSVTKVSPFRKYELKAKLSWYNKNPVNVKVYNYTLTQYTPSVYANIYIVINESDFIQFKDIEKFKIEDRTLELWFEPELYSNNLKQSFDSGPIKYCVVEYTYSNVPPDYLDTKDEKKYESARLIKLSCIDRTFYLMTLNQESHSYANSTISDVVSRIVKKNKAAEGKIVKTDYQYNWLQPQLTDYQMIRSMLPYSQSSSGDFMYTFYMYNNKAYFAPISTGKVKPVKLIVDENSTSSQYQTSDMKFLIERYGSLDKMMVYDYGYGDFSMTKPAAMTTEAYRSNMPSFGQHAGISSKYIKMAMDDKNLQKIYLSNLRHRIYTFSRIMSINTMPIPDITPIDCVEVIKYYKGMVRDLDGIYYVLAVSYTYGMTNENPMQPTMSLILSSELDAKSTNKPEGKAIQ